MTESSILFLQNNVARKQEAMISCLEIGVELKIDFVLFQEPWVSKDNSLTISHPSYNALLPEPKDIRPRVAIFYRKLSRFQFCQRNDICQDSDIIIIDILGTKIKDFQLINIYNEKSLKEDQDDWTIERALVNITPSKNTIIGGDFNAHHPWWNSAISTPTRAQALVPWLEKYEFELLNEPDLPTFYREGMVNKSIIDLVFITKRLNQRQTQWEINPNLASGADHEVLLYSIQESNTDLVENPIYAMPYNLEKADWSKFSKKLLELDQSPDYRWGLHTENDLGQEMRLETSLELEVGLENEAYKLQKMIQIAADYSIPRKKASHWSKAWWSEKLTKLRKALGQTRKLWKRSPTPENHQAYIEARNIYFQEIKEAKSSCWNLFLENAQGKEIFKAFNYTKKRLTQRLPILKYREGEEEKSAISFSEKCHALLTTLFQKPPDSEPIDWSAIPRETNPDWEWPEIKPKEVREAIFTSSIKKAPGPDELSFLILQKAYMNLEIRFNTLYRLLIGKGYHPRCWKTAKGVILRKSASIKRDFSMPKAYRVISLLNCLGKIAEKIIARRLSTLAESSSLLYYDQIGGRQRKSAIDAVMSLVHDIQTAKHRKEMTTTLFIDVKGAFDHVSTNQLLRVCIRLGLPSSLISWISSFLSDRKIQLAFDNETSQETPIQVGIPQGSPISPILFLIYIRYLFETSEEIDEEERAQLSQVRYLSYIDDIALVTSSKSLEANCRLLEKAASKLFQKGLDSFIQFDQEKIELIHFHARRSLNPDQYQIRLGNYLIKPQKLIKWLGIYLDPKLLFTEHVTKKVTEATRVFYQIERLSNTERGLSFQAMRQLYIACITSIADYGVPIWWAGQNHLLEKYQKLQNMALRKILGAFRTSPIRAMEIEAAIPPPRVRFNKICRNYILRTAYFNKNHPIRARMPSDFLNQGSCHIERSGPLNWDEEPTREPIRSEDPDYRPKNRKKFPSQLYRLLSLFSFQKWQGNIADNSYIETPWQETLDDIVKITISGKSKEEAALDHKGLVSRWAQSHDPIDDKIIIYSDGSQSDRGYNGAGIFITNKAFTKQDCWAWNLGKECEVYDAELYAIKKALKTAYRRLQIQTLDIWIFSDSQAALQALKKGDPKANQALYRDIYKWAQKIREKGVQIHLDWVPGHMGIYGNAKADECAKYGANWSEKDPKTFLSISFLKKKLKAKALEEWQEIWGKAKISDHYKQFKMQPKWKPSPLKLSKQLWSTIIQLKLGHGYFRSYLVRLPAYNSGTCNLCQTNQEQTPYHLLLHCSAYRDIRYRAFSRMDRKDYNLFYLFSKEGQESLIKFLKETKIATRRWHLGAS